MAAVGGVDGHSQHARAAAAATAGMSGPVWGGALALAGLGLAALAGRMVRRSRRPLVIGGIIGGCGVGALQLAGFADIGVGWSAAILVIYGGLAGAVAETAGRGR